MCRLLLLPCCCWAASAISLLAQRENPPKAVEPEPINSNAPPPNAAARIRFVGNTKFSNRELSAAIADPLAAIQQTRSSLPLADDTAYYIGRLLSTTWLSGGRCEIQN